MQLGIRTFEDEAAKKLARKIKRLAPHLSCSGCGKRDFALIEDPAGQMRTILRREAIPTSSKPYSITQVVASLVCTSCGHIEQFADSILNGASPEDFGKEVDNE